MTTKPIQQLFMDFLKMPYFKNYAAASGMVHNFAKHEEAIVSVMEKHGYAKYNPQKKLHKKDFVNKNTNFLSDMPSKSFIEQPFGTHSSPDFFIKTETNNIIPLEAKSSETSSHPTYNSGGVKQGYYYIFCSKKTNSTTVYRGEDIITEEQQNLINEYIKEEKNRAAILNNKLKTIDIHSRGVSFYPRPMICQSGGAAFTNYFTHQNKTRDENRAIESLF